MNVWSKIHCQVRKDWNKNIALIHEYYQSTNQASVTGKVLSVTSNEVQFSQSWKKFDPDVVIWENGSCFNKLHLTMLRVFFVRGQTQPTKIGNIASCS